MRGFNHILFGDGCRQGCGDTPLCGDMPYRVNEMNTSLAAINSKKDGLQHSRALRSAAKQWRHGGPVGFQLGTPRIYLWEQSDLIWQEEEYVLPGRICLRPDTAWVAAAEAKKPNPVPICVGPQAANRNSPAALFLSNQKRESFPSGEGLVLRFSFWWGPWG